MSLKRQGIVAFTSIAALAAMASPAMAAPAVVAGDGSDMQLFLAQACGSAAGGGFGAPISLSDPHIVDGRCNNGNSTLHSDPAPGAISVIDATALKAFTYQLCGTDGGNLGTIGVSVDSLSMVTNGCRNNNIAITAPAAGASGPAAVSAVSGSAVTAGAIQGCGTNLAAGVSVVAGIKSPTIATGGCDNANVTISPQPASGNISALTGSNLSALNLQTCGSNVAMLGAIGISVSEPNYVQGDCNNGNTDIG